jgi:metal-responsive CopG/Arc/MetJ family transcriptional regulator
MSVAARNTALLLLSAVGAVAAVNAISKPTRTQGIADAMRKQLDEYNATVQPEQERS